MGVQKGLLCQHDRNGNKNNGSISDYRAIFHDLDLLLIDLDKNLSPVFITNETVYSLYRKIQHKSLRQKKSRTTFKWQTNNPFTVVKNPRPSRRAFPPRWACGTGPSRGPRDQRSSPWFWKARCSPGKNHNSVLELVTCFF